MTTQRSKASKLEEEIKFMEKFKDAIVSENDRSRINEEIIDLKYKYFSLTGRIYE